MPELAKCEERYHKLECPEEGWGGSSQTSLCKGGCEYCLEQRTIYYIGRSKIR